MKIVFLLVLFLTTSFIGFKFSKKYKVRSSFFSSLVQLCQKFDIEINYSRERLKNLFINLDEKIKKNLGGLDKNFLAFLDKQNDLEKDTLFQNIKFLKESEKDSIFPFFKMLGRSDVDSQSKEIKNYQSRFESLSAAAGQENKKYGGLCIKLGIVCGLFLIVLFIWGERWMLRLFLRLRRLEFWLQL